MPVPDIAQATRPVSVLTTPTAPLHATCASGLQHVLRDELVSLGLDDVDARGAGASFSGGLAAGYTACLHSRVANRILLPLHAGPAATPDELYALVREIDWSAHLDATGSLAVDFFSANSGITHTQYGALKVKDAVVDQFRDAFDVRPDVDRETPQVRINVYVFRDRARIALDLSGASLHRRGYRGDGGPAPLKENVAAALLLAAGWPARAAAGESFVDPMCGSGTLVVEAALIAANRAPALGRDYFGFLGWKGHDAALWQQLEADARAAIRTVAQPIRGFDRDSAAVTAATASLMAAGIAGDIVIERRDMRDATAPGASIGLLASNPPWGERLAASADDYRAIGQALSRGFPGWRCALFTSVTAPLGALALPMSSALEVVNGGIDCRLSIGDVPALRAPRERPRRPSSSEPDKDVAGGVTHDGQPDPEPALNRIGKNLRTLKGFRRQQSVRAFRVYDADLPDFAIAVDLFDCGEAGDERHLVVQEYEAPRTVNAALAADRLEAFVAALPRALDTDPGRVHLKTRSRQRGDEQYRRRGAGDAGAALHGESADAITAVLHERGARYALNFSDYLDVGLFLDHRRVRRHIRESMASGGHFLNLFAYTSAATVDAALGGATTSLSVDLSKRYTSWSERNLALNGIDPATHRVVRSDVMTWLGEAAGAAAPFDLILLDPPTHSNSSSTQRDWDVQADHVAAIDACMRRLSPGGLLIFSNNFRRFRLDAALSDRYAVEDRTAWSIDPDFKRRTRIHGCWFIR